MRFVDTNILLYRVSTDPLEAARTRDCEVLFGEDLNHGQDYDGVRVVNPFL